VHVPLHYDEVSDTYSVGAPGLFLGKASKLRDLFDRAIPAEALQETLERILRGTNPNIIVNVR